MADKETKVQIDRRNDGHYSATIKLIGWDLNMLRAFISANYLSVPGRHMALQMAAGLQDELENAVDPPHEEEPSDLEATS